MKIRKKILTIFKRKEETIRKISKATNIPKSTVHYLKQKIRKRIKSIGTDFWETELGNQFTIKLVTSAIYVFGIKSGNGAGRFKEFFEMLELENYLPTSESTILNIIRHIEGLILEYKKMAEQEAHSKVKEIELILGVDETWFDKMYLVCQELSSGYIFFETESEQRDAASWNKHIKKNSLSYSQMPQSGIL